MLRVNRVVLAVFGMALALGTVCPSLAWGADPSPFAVFVDDYFNAAFEASPSRGTSAGLHQYDNRLEDGSAEAVRKRVETVKALQARLDKLRAGALTEGEAIDAEVLDGQLKSELLELDTLQSWRHNPMGYIGGPAGSIDDLMKRDFAPAAMRLRSVIARLKAASAMFEALRANVVNPPREFTDLAIRIGAGSIGFFKDTVRDWAKEAAGNDAELLREFNAVDDKVVKEITETVDWLKKDL
jgi:hypothetical protein